MKGLEKRVRGAMETSLILIGREAKEFFGDNFKKQGFDDKNVEKWKPRKGEIVGGIAMVSKRSKGSRGILIGKGRGVLRNSIQVGKISKTKLSVSIKTDLDYAAVHNFGLRAGRGKGFKMEQRQFIGDSYNLNEKVKKIIVNKLDKVFKK